MGRGRFQQIEAALEEMLRAVICVVGAALCIHGSELGAANPWEYMPQKTKDPGADVTQQGEPACFVQCKAGAAFNKAALMRENNWRTKEPMRFGCLKIFERGTDYWSKDARFPKGPGYAGDTEVNGAYQQVTQAAASNSKCTERLAEFCKRCKCMFKPAQTCTFKRFLPIPPTESPTLSPSHAPSVAPPTETPTMAPTFSPTERSTLEDLDPEVALEGLRVDMGLYVTKKEGENFIKQAEADLARANGLAVATLNADMATAQQKANDQLTEWSLKLLTRENAETDASEKVLTGIVTQLETQAKVRIAKVKGPVLAAKVRYERSLAKMPVWESQALKMKTPNEIDDARRMQMIKSAIKITEADAMQNGRGYSGAPVAREEGDNRREAEAMQNERAKSQKP